LAPPPAPAAITIQSGSKQASLTWTPQGAGVSYNVKRSMTSCGPYTTTGTTSAPGFVNTGLTSDTTYWYVVTAVNGSGESPNSAEVSATPSLPPVPDAPGLNTPVSVDAATIQWNWWDNSYADHYELHDDAHTLLASPPGRGASY